MKIRSTTTDRSGRTSSRAYSVYPRETGEQSLVERVFSDRTVSEFTVTRTRNDGSFWTSVRYERVPEVQEGQHQEGRQVIDVELERDEVVCGFVWDDGWGSHGCFLPPTHPEFDHHSCRCDQKVLVSASE